MVRIRIEVDGRPLVFVGFGSFTGDIVEYARIAALDATISREWPPCHGVIARENPWRTRPSRADTGHGDAQNPA
jgi:hypothetical protein